MISEKQRYEFTKGHENQVKYIKSKCIDISKLKLPNDNDDLILETDSSESTWSIVLKRRDNEKEEICRYTSGTFIDTEERYHINENEFLVVVK